MKNLLILLTVSNVALSMNIYVDVCVPGEEPWRIETTVDPIVEAYRFIDYFFENKDINPRAYQLLHKGRKLNRNCQVGEYRSQKDGQVYLTLTRIGSKEPCIYNNTDCNN